MAGRDLKNVEVLLVPDGPADAAYKALGADGRDALASWTRGGGRYVGWQGGIHLAARLGLTTTVLSEPTSDVPGTLLRALGAKWTERRHGDVVQYVIGNPKGPPADHHPFARDIPARIGKAGITPIAVTLP